MEHDEVELLRLEPTVECIADARLLRMLSTVDGQSDLFEHTELIGSFSCQDRAHCCLD